MDSDESITGDYPGTNEAADGSGKTALLPDDGWDQLYLYSALMHPTEDDGLDTSHLKAFDTGPGIGAVLNTHGLTHAETGLGTNTAETIDGLLHEWGFAENTPAHPEPLAQACTAYEPLLEETSPEMLLLHAGVYL